MTPTFKDHFSGHADDYRRYRPTYPEALFDRLAAEAPTRDLAWDCGTGNAQAATALAGHFARVVATDASVPQVAQAPATPDLLRAAATAEAAPFADRSVDLVTVAQALHWFDLEAFYAETCRVAKPGAQLVAWCYGRLTAAPAIDALIDPFYDAEIGPYWPPERQLIEGGYRALPFPFERRATPPMAMTAEWDVAAMLGYLRSWSAVRRYRAEHRHDPVARLETPLADAWGPGRRTVRWPLAFLWGEIFGYSTSLSSSSDSGSVSSASSSSSSSASPSSTSSADVAKR